MGKFASVLAACIHFFFGPFIFKEPEYHGGSPILSYMIVVLAIGCVLWTVPIYPRRLRKLFWSGNFMVQYLSALFLIEFIMASVWSPLETTIINLPVGLAKFLEESFRCGEICEVLKSRGVGFVFSYLLSSLILIGALHSTRIVNLQIITQKGVKPFIMDASARFKKFLTVLSRRFDLTSGFTLKDTKPKSKTRKEDDYSTDEDNACSDPAIPNPSNVIYEEPDVPDCCYHYHYQ